MEAKPTLKLDKAVMDSAKSYAGKHNRSLPKLVENYFSHLLRELDCPKKHSPILESLSGILSEDDPEKFAWEDERAVVKGWIRPIITLTFLPTDVIITT